MTPMVSDFALDLAALRPGNLLALGSGSASEGSAGLGNEFARMLAASHEQISARVQAAPEAPLQGEEGVPAVQLPEPLPQALALMAAPQPAAAAGGKPLPPQGADLPQAPLADVSHAARGLLADVQPAAAPVETAPVSLQPPVEPQAGGNPALAHRGKEDPAGDGAPDLMGLDDDGAMAHSSAAAAALLTASTLPASPIIAPALIALRGAMPSAPVVPAPRVLPVAAAVDAPADSADLAAALPGLARTASAARSPGEAASSAASGPLSPAALATPALASPTSAAAPALALAPSPALVAEAGAALGDATRPAPGADAEAVLDQISALRDAARSVRSEVVLRHGEFGTVNLRIDAAGASGEWRALISNRDPGFVPAVQAALAERAVAASAETSANLTHQNSGGHSGGQAAGQGSGQSPYGSSPGSQQGSSQPYSGQTPGEGRRHAAASAGTANDTGQSTASDGGLFA